LFKDLMEHRLLFLQSIADKTRLKIIKALMEDEKSVGELVAELNSSQANVSAHLKTLKNSGILKRRQEGKYVFYSLKDKSICDFLDYLDKMLSDMRKQALESISL